MKICTMTCHDVYNYGASLQAFALQQYLESLGHDVKIIDYKPSYQKTYKFTTDFSEYSPYYNLYKKYPILPWLKGCKNYISNRKTIGRKRAFDKFTKEFLRLTERFSSYQHLVRNAPKADVYIAGSDQIWNTRLPNGSDPAFYLQFGSLSAKRISYAASFALSSVYGGYDCLAKSLLSNIESISVREPSGLELLKGLGLSGTQVLDPVFLLSQEEWIKSLHLNTNQSRVKGKYVLAYDLQNSPGLQERAISLSKESNIPVVCINDKYQKKYAKININNAGPIEFLELILHAEYVVTDSFHATAFCVIFRKIFWSYFKNDKNIRIQDFLSLVNLHERFNAQNNNTKVDWVTSGQLLTESIQESKKYIQSSIALDK